MNDETGTHFASDGDLLSRYVLGRLSGADREKIESHAAGCPACMDALQSEMRIAAGVRRLGRDNLKSELKRRIAAEPEHARWPRILSAAAVAVVAGLGVYYSFFSGGGNLSPRVEGNPPLAIKTEPRGEAEANAPRTGLADRVSAQKAAETPASPGARLAAKQAQEAPSLRQSGEFGKKSMIPEREVALPETASGGAALEKTAREFWSDGIVQVARPALDAASARGALHEGNNNVLMSRSGGANEENARRKDALSRDQGVYVIRQEPSSSLPADLESHGGDHSRVPTRVDRRGNTTTMTLYLDSLVAEKVLQVARVDAVRDDSVVVTVGAKRILYRLAPLQGAPRRQK